MTKILWGMLLCLCLTSSMQLAVKAQPKQKFKIDRPSHKEQRYFYKSMLVDSTDYKYLYGDSSDVYLLVKIITVINAEADAKVLKVSLLGHEDVIEYTLKSCVKAIYTSSDGLEYAPVKTQYDTLLKPNDVLVVDYEKKSITFNHVSVDDSTTKKLKDLFMDSGYSSLDKFFGTDKTTRRIGEHWDISLKEMLNSFSKYYPKESIKGAHPVGSLDTATIHNVSCYKIDCDFSLANINNLLPKEVKNQFRIDSNMVKTTFTTFVPLYANAHEQARQYIINSYSHFKANTQDAVSGLTDMIVRNKRIINCAFMNN